MVDIEKEIRKIETYVQGVVKFITRLKGTILFVGIFLARSTAFGRTFT